MSNSIDILNSLRVPNASPLDSKVYFKTIDELKDLSRNQAYSYYKDMEVICAENSKKYKWKEVDENDTTGILESNFQYMDNYTVNGIDYSLKYYNFVEVVSDLKYINTNHPPISIGGFLSEKPATPPEGLDFQETIDKFLFPGIDPKITNFNSSPQPLYNQPVNYDINLTWDISIETVGASIDTVTLDYRRGSDSWDNISLTDNTSATHTITVLDNRDITYRLKVVDTMGNEKTSTFNRTVQNYQKPSIDVKVNSKNSVTLERGSDVTVTGTIDRNRQYVPLSSWSLKMSINDGDFNEVLNNTSDGTEDISGLSNITFTHSFVNGESYNKVEFRLDVTDIETTNSSSVRPVNYKDYSYFGVSTLDTFNISLFGSLTEVKSLNTKGYTPPPFASTIPVGSYMWYLYPTSYGDLDDLLLGPSPIGLGGLIIDTNKTFTNSNGVNVSYYAVRSSDDGAYQEGQQITFI